MKPYNTVLFMLPTVCITLAVSSSAPISAEEDEAKPQVNHAQLEFFESQIRPILAKRCYECHSSETGEKNGALVLQEEVAGLCFLQKPLMRVCCFRL
jgi:uncharacterized membrane protein